MQSTPLAGSLLQVCRTRPQDSGFSAVVPSPCPFAQTTVRTEAPTTGLPELSVYVMYCFNSRRCSSIFSLSFGSNFNGPLSTLGALISVRRAVVFAATFPVRSCSVLSCSPAISAFSRLTDAPMIPLPPRPATKEVVINWTMSVGDTAGRLENTINQAQTVPQVCSQLQKHRPRSFISSFRPPLRNLKSIILAGYSL